MSRNFFHMSSCRNFTTSGLIFKAFIHFKIIYVSGVKQRSHFFSFFSLWLILPQSFPGGSVVKNTPANTRDARDTGSIPGSGRSLGGGNGNLLQYSFLENSTDRGAWQATVCACCVLSCFSRVQLFVTLWTVTRLALPSMGILQVRILTFSRGSSRPRDWTHASALASAGGFFTLAPW